MSQNPIDNLPNVFGEDELGNSSALSIDSYSKGLHTIEQDHRQIHAGNGYQLSGLMASIAAAGVAYFYIIPGTPIHWRLYKFVANGGPFDVELFENPTVTANGTLLVPKNRNRLSVNESSAEIYTGPTVSAPGTSLDIDRSSLTGTGNRGIGELESVAVEWIIDGGNTYLLRVTNNDSSAIVPLYRFFWYES